MTDSIPPASPSPRLRALDLCAGAGGLSLGAQLAGFDVLGVELDPDAADTHRRHVGPCVEADLHTWSPPESFDAAIGGIPCQPFSMAGKRLGLEDPRYLLPSFLRIAREASARVIVIENVRGLVRDVRAFRVVLDACEAEYHVAWTVLDAADYGVPQHRDRLFIVGFRDSMARARFRWPSATHAPPGSLFGRPYVTVREALNLGDGAFRAGPKENARSGQLQGMRLLDVDAPAYTIGGHSFDLLDRPSPTITATEHKSAMRGTQPMHRRRRASERLSDALGALDRPAPTIKANTWHEGTSERASQRPGGALASALTDALDRPSPTITAGGTEGGGGPEPLGHRKTRDELYRALASAGLADRPATTVQADPRLAVAGHHDRQQHGAVRLTPEQCAALQGFPTGWTWAGNKSSQYRQIGNAVPPPLAEAVMVSVRRAFVTG